MTHATMLPAYSHNMPTHRRFGAFGPDRLERPEPRGDGNSNGSHCQGYLLPVQGRFTKADTIRFLYQGCGYVNLHVFISGFRRSVNFHPKVCICIYVQIDRQTQRERERPGEFGPKGMQSLVLASRSAGAPGEKKGGRWN